MASKGMRRCTASLPMEMRALLRISRWISRGICKSPSRKSIFSVRFSGMLVCKVTHHIHQVPDAVKLHRIVNGSPEAPGRAVAFDSQDLLPLAALQKGCLVGLSRREKHGVHRGPVLEPDWTFKARVAVHLFVKQ